MKYVLLCCAAAIVASSEPRDTAKCWQVRPYVWIYGAQAVLDEARRRGVTEAQIAEVRRRCKI